MVPSEHFTRSRLWNTPENLIGLDSSFADDLAAGTIFAFLFNFKDYVINTVYDMGITRKQDWDTEDMLTKAVMSLDGKVVDKRSLVTIAKKS